MGCLKNILKAVILVFAVIGFISIGGKDTIKKKWDEFTNPPQDVMLQRAKKVGDFSKIGDEYEIDKAASAVRLQRCFGRTQSERTKNGYRGIQAKNLF